MEHWNRIKNMIMEEMDLSREVADEEIRKLIDAQIIQCSKENYIPIEERHRLSRELFFDIRKLGILQELIEDDSITEIMVNGVEHIFIERNGKIQEWDQNFASKEKLSDVIQQIVAECNRMVNEE